MGKGLSQILAYLSEEAQGAQMNINDIQYYESLGKEKYESQIPHYNYQDS